MRPSNHTAGLLFGDLLELYLALTALYGVLVLVVEAGPGVPVVVAAPGVEGVRREEPFSAFRNPPLAGGLAVSLPGLLEGAPPALLEVALGGEEGVVGLV